MKPPVHDASARQYSGEPSSVLGPNGGRQDRPQNPDLTEVEAKLRDWSIGRHRSCGVPGGHCITLDHLWASVAI